MRQLLQAIRISVRNLLAAKMRSFLTILGVVIGVAAVVIIIALGASAQSLIVDQIAGIGSNLIGVLPGASDENGPPAAVLGITVTTLTYDDLEALRDGRSVPEVEDGAGYVLGTTTVEYGRESNSYSFTGTTASYTAVENSEIEEGRFFVEDEERNLARVVVLGSNVADELFDDNDPVNKTIEIYNQAYRVIGVLRPRGSSTFGISSQDDTVYIPLKTAQKLVMGINHLGFIRLKAKSEGLIDAAIANTKATLRDRHDIDDPVNDDFSVRSQLAALDTIRTVTSALRYFVLSVGSISLVVGGVGIMNIMLITVAQRVREVGLRKAVGARGGEILVQFLIEAVTITVIGGIIGILLGVTVSYAVSVGAQYAGYNWPFLISPVSIIIAAVVSILIGTVFGIYPAAKASKISPMEALRYE